MKALSKFFTPPLTREDRDAFYRCLGLGAFEFFFVETFGPLTVRAISMHGLRRRALLSLGTIEGGLPVLRLEHPAQQLPEEPIQLPRTLWEEVFPYPFSLMGRLFGPQADAGLTLTPPSTKAQLKLLWEAFNRLEEAMAATEVSCLWIRGGPTGDPVELPILFHHVRRRRVRVGTAPHLLELGGSYRRGTLTPDALREHFGTHSAFFYLGLEGLGTGPDLIPSLVDRLLRVLSSAENPGDPHSPVIIGTGPSLPIELSPTS
jgi:hypothetical protein